MVTRSLGVQEKVCTYRVVVTHEVFLALKFVQDNRKLRKYFMHVKMSNTIQPLRYIKHRPRECISYGDMCQRKIWLQNIFYGLDTATTVNGIHNKEVLMVLKEMSTILMLRCIKSTQIELKCGIHKS